MQWKIRTKTIPIGNESVPIQLAQCRFPGLAVSSDKILVYFSNKTYGNNFIKHHSETVMVWSYQNTDCSLRKKIYCVIYYNFRHTFVPYKHTEYKNESLVVTSAYGASPLLVSRASRSAVASFSQLEADRKVLERAHRPGSTGPVASNSHHHCYCSSDSDICKLSSAEAERRDAQRWAWY